MKGCAHESDHASGWLHRSGIGPSARQKADAAVVQLRHAGRSLQSACPARGLLRRGCHSGDGQQLSGAARPDGGERGARAARAAAQGGRQRRAGGNRCQWPRQGHWRSRAARGLLSHRFHPRACRCRGWLWPGHRHIGALCRRLFGGNRDVPEPTAQHAACNSNSERQADLDCAER